MAPESLEYVWNHVRVDLFDALYVWDVEFEAPVLLDAPHSIPEKFWIQLNHQLIHHQVSVEERHCVLSLNLLSVV